MENSRSRRWMDYNRTSKEYSDGVESFLNHAFREKQNGETISCPCKNCVLFYQVNRATAYDHLVADGIINEHISEIKRLHRKRRLTQHQLNRLHFDTFHEWFKEQVSELDLTSSISTEVKTLARGPCHFARRFNSFHMNNGYRFCTKQYEEFMQTQNSRVMVVSVTDSFASTSDSAPKSANITYYGRLTDIVELNYYEEFKVVLFKCDWVDVTQGRGVMKDDLGFTLVNFSHLIHSGNRESDEPFVFAGQAQQVIFIQDPVDHEWFVPRSIKPRDIFDMGEKNNMRFDSSMESDTTDLTILENICDLEHENNDWVRFGVDGIEIDMSSQFNIPQAEGETDLESQLKHTAVDTSDGSLI